MSDEVQTAVDSGLPNLTAAERAAMAEYLALILRWNEVTNLTRITEPEQMVTEHLVDSLSVNPFITGNSILDVGSGAGLPGIPLALMNPDKDFILLDSNGKKTRFMTQASIELGLGNVEIVQARAESFSGQFDHVICRAFSALESFLESCKHLLTSDGNLLAMKGPEAQQEMARVTSDSYQLSHHPIELAGRNRCLIEARLA